MRTDLVLVTHEHLDHNGVEAIEGEPAIVRSTAGRGPNTIFVFSLDAVRVAHFGDFGQTGLREGQAQAIGQVDLLILPVGGGPTIGAGQAAEIVQRLSPRWLLPMHYRTPRIGFLETADAFLEQMPRVERLEDRGFDTGELAEAGETTVVVPAAP